MANGLDETEGVWNIYMTENKDILDPPWPHEGDQMVGVKKDPGECAPCLQCIVLI